MKTMRKLNSEIGKTLSVMVFLLSIPLFALGDESDANAKAEAEIKSTFGTIPLMMKAYPEHSRAAAWEWFKSRINPNSPIPEKYRALIALAVAAQVPCQYCVYSHLGEAKSLGASEAEIFEAVAIAADTRHWSTILNGHGISLDEYKKEEDAINEYIKKQSKAK